MPKGEVRHYDPQKGTGFIDCEDGRVAYFFHLDVEVGAEPPARGDRVIFELLEGQKGLEARRVRQAPR